MTRASNSSRAFNEADILRQFDVLERLTLPSLRDQDDPSFRLVMLSSARMPDECKDHLTWLLNHYLPGRSEVLYSRPMVPGRVFRRYMQGLGRGDAPVIQTQVLDGEAFGKRFVQRLREHGIESWATGPTGEGRSATGGTFISFKRGLNLRIERKKLTALEPTTAPSVPFGLSLVARPSSRYNPTLINADGLGVKFPHVSIRSQGLHCLRAISGESAKVMPAIEQRILDQAINEFNILRAPHDIRVSEDRAQPQPTDVNGVVRLRRAG
ncbi:Putative rhamnosyl transferase [Litoreibacter janthinus]|uniref:Putative rhamnosyl transferase n=2 Tax=Litoreibacter janthinus TaxID=670154 RepID=A0A1I6H227_9RHOB|nr:Putative rhamnosyl transferase [Litoreibacter janthinus]